MSWKKIRVWQKPNRVRGKGLSCSYVSASRPSPDWVKLSTLEGKWANRHEDDTSSWVTCRTGQSSHSDLSPSSRLESCRSFPGDTYPNFTLAAAKYVAVDRTVCTVRGVVVCKRGFTSPMHLQNTQNSFAH